MKKLNQAKIRWIIREMNKGEISVYGIGKQQGVTPQWVRILYKRYLKTGEYPYPRPPGRRPIPVTAEERDRVVAMKKMHPLAGAVTLEMLSSADGKPIPHNRIHRILKKEGLAKNEPKKQKKRKWVRYQRKHSNSLWHGDWFENGEKEHILPFEDDASRFITGFDVFPNATTENAVIVMQQAIEGNGCPKQVMIDHGIQFTSIPRDSCEKPEPNEFQKYLRAQGIQHIKGRVKHPQSNGKVEKLSDTLIKLRPYFKYWQDVIEYYNYQRPHWSLNMEKCETPFKAYIRKMRPSVRDKFVKDHTDIVSKWAPEYIQMIEDK